MPTLPGAHPTNQKKGMTGNAKMTIVSQTQVNSSVRQILPTLQLGTDAHIDDIFEQTERLLDDL